MKTNYLNDTFNLTMLRDKRRPNFVDHTLARQEIKSAQNRKKRSHWNRLREGP
jgi:hypothetical protein